LVVPILKLPPKIDSPRIRVILVIFDPRMLVIAISGCLSKTATAETTSSGKEVPKATMVKPIIKGEIPTFLAIFSELLIKISAEEIKTTKGTTRDKKAGSNILKHFS
jgi:hypothetical protein